MIKSETDKSGICVFVCVILRRDVYVVKKGKVLFL